MEKLEKSPAVLEGIVTNICVELAMFEVDNRTQVFSSKLPAIDDKVRLEFKHFAASRTLVECILLTAECKLETSGSLTTGTLQNLPIDKHLKLGQIYNHLKNLGHKRHISLEHIFNALMRIDYVPENVQMINSFRYIDCVRSEMYSDLNDWNFGVHDSCSNTLVTYFYVNPKYGTLYCSDFKKTLPCVVTNSNNNCFLPDFIHRMVLVRSYKVVTEIYAGRNPLYGTEALLFDLKDVIALQIEQSLLKGCKEFPYQDFDCSDCFEGGKRLIVVSKSVPTVQKDGSVQTFLEACILNEDDGKVEDRIVFILNSSCTTLLQLNCVYKYFYVDSSCLKETKCDELNYLSCAKIQKVDGDFIFVSSSEPTIGQVAAVEAKKENTRQFREVLEGVFVLKNFAKVPGMSCKKRMNCPRFGCPADDRICILTVRTDLGQEWTVYMNDWDNMTTPVCLIPNIRLIVRDVVRNGTGNSYKSTPMTSFEIVSYEPTVNFETASLFDDNNWGRPSHMGVAGIPNGAILWDQPSTFFILGLKIKILPTNELDAVITLVATDPLGEYKVIAKQKGGVLLFRSLLNLEEPLFKPIHDALVQYKCEFDLGNSVNPQNMDPDVVQLKKRLSIYFNAVNGFGLRLDLKCRKIDEEKKSRKPVYYLLDARMKARL